MMLIFIGSTDLLASRHTSRIIGPVLRYFIPHITETQILHVQMFVRKLGHVSEYAILAGLAWRALHKTCGHRLTPQRVLVRAWLLATLYAGTDEFHQSFVRTRDASVRDVAIDSFGAALGLSLISWSRKPDATNSTKPPTSKTAL